MFTAGDGENGPGFGPTRQSASHGSPKLGRLDGTVCLGWQSYSSPGVNVCERFYSSSDFKSQLVQEIPVSSHPALPTSPAGKPGRGSGPGSNRPNVAAYG